MKFDHSKLKGRILERNETYETLSKKVGISPSTLCLKLNGTNFFKVSEIEEISKVLEIESNEIPAYFFTKKLEK